MFIISIFIILIYYYCYIYMLYLQQQNVYNVLFNMVFTWKL